MQRRLPVGAEIVGDGVHFRVWAPDHERVAVVIDGDRNEPLNAEADGYYSGLVRGIGEGTRYAFRLDDDTTLYPDPASRHQPEGPHGASCVVDPTSYRWGDASWSGITLAGQVFYEMHVGTFTRAGTFDAAREKLSHLADLGITCIEVMPLADFAGDFGWGYDGVNWFAPTRLYGTPDSFRRFVDAAHALNLGVILDVVYNHLGPDGNFMPAFAKAYYSKKHGTDWGQGINFDDAGSAAVRECVIANARHWIEEYHLDGLRLDATQDIKDVSETHVVKAIVDAAREAAGKRSIIVVAENEPQDTTLVRTYGVDAMWNDDFHHTALVALTGRREAYYTDYKGSAQELISAAKYGFLYQGQRYAWQKQRRGGAALDLEPSTFVSYLQNHDQVANSANGARMSTLTSPGRLRALTALLLLGPGTPLLFQGQEYMATTPFLYFADHSGELGDGVRKGRADFLKQFPSIATRPMQEALRDPTLRSTFEASCVDWDERARSTQAIALHRDLLTLRREFVPTRVDGAVLGHECFVLRLFGKAVADDRLLIVNLGPDLDLTPAPEPLLGLGQDRKWRTLWSSDDIRYGGLGSNIIDDDDRGLRVPSHSAVLLSSDPRGKS